jgi:hypothetical protein
MFQEPVPCTKSDRSVHLRSLCFILILSLNVHLNVLSSQFSSYLQTKLCMHISSTGVFYISLIVSS